jgi:hypothetical protein
MVFTQEKYIRVQILAETHCINRQADRHDCLPSAQLTGGPDQIF